MDQNTILKLNQINKEFYDKIAANFDSSRQYFWKGWESIWDFIIENKLSISNIVDIGCGNGRFYKFLEDKIYLLCTTGNEAVDFEGSILKNNFKYLGLDNNDFLLNKAKEEFKNLKNASFEFQDILELNLNNQKYDVISLFGVMHHIPSYNKRLDFLLDLKNNLSEEGIICMSFWQFMSDEKESEKVSDWNHVNIDNTEIEKNDYLLSWNRGEQAFRYCHFADDVEIEKLISDSGLKILKNYCADGKSESLNRYVILSK